MDLENLARIQATFDFISDLYESGYDIETIYYLTHKNIKDFLTIDCNHNRLVAMSRIEDILRYRIFLLDDVDIVPIVARMNDQALVKNVGAFACRGLDANMIRGRVKKWTANMIFQSVDGLKKCGFTLDELSGYGLNANEVCVLELCDIFSNRSRRNEVIPYIKNHPVVLEMILKFPPKNEFVKYIEMLPDPVAFLNEVNYAPYYRITEYFYRFLSEEVYYCGMCHCKEFLVRQHPVFWESVAMIYLHTPYDKIHKHLSDDYRNWCRETYWLGSLYGDESIMKLTMKGKEMALRRCLESSQSSDGKAFIEELIRIIDD